VYWRGRKEMEREGERERGGAESDRKAIYHVIWRTGCFGGLTASIFRVEELAKQETNRSRMEAELISFSCLICLSNMKMEALTLCFAGSL
jgi:hypothetical protein